MQVEIRRVTAEDAAIFARVADGVFDEPIDRGRLGAYLAAPGHHMLVALRGGEVVAQVAAVVHRHPDKPSELYIDEVAVATALQRQGIARRMLDEMFALGKARDAKRPGSARSTTIVPPEVSTGPATQRPNRS
jgi:ribosomal protein S18 acetylase RimI-like enzyme